MQFILIRKHPWGPIKDRVLAPFELEDTAKRSPGEHLFVCVLVKVTEDFKEDGLMVITSDTDSIQIRPKQLFCNTKGYYYKLHGKNVYVDNDEVRIFLRELNFKASAVNEKLKLNPKAQSYAIT